MHDGDQPGVGARKSVSGWVALIAQPLLSKSFFIYTFLFSELLSLFIYAQQTQNYVELRRKAKHEDVKIELKQIKLFQRRALKCEIKIPIMSR